MKSGWNVWLVAFAVTVVGCGTNKMYRISSDPPGAVVSSGNVIYGTTPFTTDLNAILPHRAYDGKLSASRLLTFTKEGYFSGSAVISEFGRARDVHVELQPEAPNGGEPQERPELSTEDRLREAMRLKEAGLITEEEYQEKRAEILGDL